MKLLDFNVIIDRLYSKESRRRDYRLSFVLMFILLVSYILLKENSSFTVLSAVFYILHLGFRVFITNFLLILVLSKVLSMLLVNIVYLIIDTTISLFISFYNYIAVKYANSKLESELISINSKLNSSGYYNYSFSQVLYLVAVIMCLGLAAPSLASLLTYLH